MKPLYLIRHAQPESTEYGKSSHWTDTDLSERGQEQAALLADKLKNELEGEELEIFSSDLKRASQTADAIAKAFGGLKINLEPGLREYNNGLGVGGSMEELMKYSDDSSAAEADLKNKPEGETWRDFYNRVAAAMDKIWEKRDPEKYLIVTAHYGANMHVVSWWLSPGLTDPGATNVSFNHHLSGLTRLVINRQGARSIDTLNDISHLFHSKERVIKREVTSRDFLPKEK
jgi:probable phosphoglycerate mutase